MYVLIKEPYASMYEHLLLNFLKKIITSLSKNVTYAYFNQEN